MKIMFIRYSEGMYQFGKKKVHIKVDNGNKIWVRTAGGYMYIDEFIDQYTLNEVVKIERDGVIERFKKQTIVS